MCVYCVCGYSKDLCCALAVIGSGHQQCHHQAAVLGIIYLSTCDPNYQTVTHIHSFIHKSLIIDIVNANGKEESMVLKLFQLLDFEVVFIIFFPLLELHPLLYKN